MLEKASVLLQPTTRFTLQMIWKDFPIVTMSGALTMRELLNGKLFQFSQIDLTKINLFFLLTFELPLWELILVGTNFRVFGCLP